MKIICSLLASILLFSACDYFGDPGSEVILNIDNEFEIGMKEVLFEDHRELEFTVRSVEMLDCKDAELKLLKSLISNAININISEIQTPSPCVQEETYPEGSVSFDLPYNNYVLGVRVQEQVPQSGELVVKQEGYRLNLSEAKGFIAELEELNRIPNAFVWGYYKANSSFEQELLEAFLTDNGYEDQDLSHLKAGNYSYFEITEDGQINISDLPSDGIVKPLAFDLLRLDDIKESVSNFKASHKDIQLILHGSDGSLL